MWYILVEEGLTIFLRYSGPMSVDGKVFKNLQHNWRIFWYCLSALAVLSHTAQRPTLERPAASVDSQQQQQKIRYLCCNLGKFLEITKSFLNLVFFLNQASVILLHNSNKMGGTKIFTKPRFFTIFTFTKSGLYCTILVQYVHTSPTLRAMHALECVTHISTAVTHQ